MKNYFSGPSQLNFTRRSSCSDGYYSCIDDALTVRRLAKGLAYAAAYIAIGLAVLFVGSAAGY